MLGAGKARFDPEQSRTFAGGWVDDAQHLQLYTRRDFELYALRSTMRHRWRAALASLERCEFDGHGPGCVSATLVDKLDRDPWNRRRERRLGEAVILLALLQLTIL